MLAFPLHLTLQRDGEGDEGGHQHGKKLVGGEAICHEGLTIVDECEHSADDEGNSRSAQPCIALPTGQGLPSGSAKYEAGVME
jgi:hypothetical protein